MLRVIAATTTLAMGVNTPAEAVVIVGLMHPRDQPYPVAEYKNIVGWAGRLGQGQRTLTSRSNNDFHQVVVAPAATSPLHGDTLATGRLLQQREGEPVEPGEILAEVLVPHPRVILAAVTLPASATAEKMARWFRFNE
jgi:hypothetical protein